MADIVERLREKRGILDNRWPGPSELDLEAANEIEHLRSSLQETDAELEKFGHVSYAQFEKELATMKAFAKELSNALLKIRPLGGSEMFVKRGGDYYADPEYCGRMIDELRADLDKEIRARIRKEKEGSVAHVGRTLREGA